jgi:cytochrome P450
MKLSVFAFRSFRKDPMQFFKRNFRDNPPFIPINAGLLSFLFVNDADAVQHVLQTNAKNYKKDFISMRSSTLLGKGLVTSDGELWKRQRKLIGPAFHQPQIEIYSQVVGATTLKLVEAWKERIQKSAEKSTTLDLHEEMVSLTLTIVVRSLFGSEIDRHIKPVSEALNSILKALHPKMNRLIDLPLWVPTSENRRMKRNMATIDRVIEELIDAREKNPSETHKDLLSSLLAQPMSRRQLRDEIITLFIAGHETTANVLSWTFYLLSKHPEHIQTISNEWKKVAGSGEVQFEQLFALPHLKKVVQESMRLYSPVWMMSRQALADDVVGGHKIKKGSVVLLCTSVIHQNPLYWNQPKEFRPERFDAKESESRPKFAYFPFGGGSRICIGSSFAMMEAMMILGVLIQNFEWELTLGQNVVPKASVVLRPSSGPYAVIRERAGVEIDSIYSDDRPNSFVM